MGGETVLVTDGQLRSALAIARSLGKRDIRVICGESTPFATTFFSRYTDETVVYPSPVSNPDGFYDFLIDFVADREIDAVLPALHETTEILSRNKDDLLQHTAVSPPAYRTFKRGWDKFETIEAANRANVPAPATRCPSSVDEAREVAAEIGFPLVIKARSSSGSRGLRFVDSRASFESSYREVHDAYPHPIVQERVPQSGNMYGAAFVYDRDSEVRAQFACEFLREYPPSGGPSTLHRSIERADVLEYGRALLDEMDWQGVALVEFKLDPRDRTPKLMEVNPRFWSSLHLPLFAGVDFPWLVLQYTLGNEVPEVMEYDAEVYARHLLPGDLIRLAAVRNSEALREFFPLVDGDVRYEVLSRDDKRATVGRLLAMARFAASPTMWKRAIIRN